VLSRGSAAALSYCLPLHPSLATLAQLIESQLVNASRIAVDQQQSLPAYTLHENCREATSSCLIFCNPPDGWYRRRAAEAADVQGML
jgi:hypothetical protein